MTAVSGIAPRDLHPFAQADATICAAGAHFDIQVTPATRSMRMRLRGLWDQPMFDQFERDYFRVVHEATRQGEVDYSLVDASGFGLQPADIIARFTAIVLRTPGSATRRTAIVVSAMINQVQAREAGSLLNARYFRTVETAVDWLFGDEA